MQTNGRDVSKIEKMGVVIQKLADDNHRVQHQFRTTAAQRNDDSKIKAEQSDYKLKKAEETNKQLVEEYTQLKNTVERLEKEKRIGKGSMLPGDFAADLDRMLDSDASFAIGRPSYNSNTKFGMIGGGTGGTGTMEMFGTDTNQVQEFEFKLHLLEHDLQSVQSENNTLVQTILGLKQELRYKKSSTDLVAIKQTMQENIDVKRDIKETDDKCNKLEQEVDVLRVKVTSTADILKSPSANREYELLKLTIDHQQTVYQQRFLEVKDLKEKLEFKQKYTEEEKRRQMADRTQSVLSMEKENTVYIKLREEMVSLMAKYKELNGKSIIQEQSTVIEQGSTLSKDHLQTLRKTNERLMNEILRLNGVIKEQKVADQSRMMKQSLSISQINYGEQSVDQSFHLNWK